MKLECYRLNESAAEMIPAVAERPWMDATYERAAYRCTPMTIANASGWELLCPADVSVTWNGGGSSADLTIAQDHGSDHIVHSHFGHGIVTFLPGILFRTDPEWAVWCRGAPNRFKDGITPLEGLVETNWLSFTFTMNWRLTRPGTVHFQKGESFCFITLTPHPVLERVQPKILPLSANPELEENYTAWAASRDDFNRRFVANEAAARKEKWQRHYLKGVPPHGAPAPDGHRVKVRMAQPVAQTSLSATEQLPAEPGSTPEGVLPADPKPDGEPVNVRMAQPVAQTSLSATEQLPAEPGSTPEGVLPPGSQPDGDPVNVRMAQPVAQKGLSATEMPVEVSSTPHGVPASDAKGARKILWIASYPKSGTTWVRAFIHNLLIQIRTPGAEAQDINAMHENTVWETPAARFEALIGRKLLEASVEDIARVRARVQKRLAASRSGPFFVKTHLAFAMDGTHPSIDLDSTMAAIYVVRNPLDITLSYAHHAGHPVDWTVQRLVEPGFRTMTTDKDACELVGTWSQNISSWLSMFQRPLHVLRYEDLLQDPVRHFGDLARFLRLSFNDEQLAAAIARSSFKALRGQEDANGFNERPESSARFFREGRANQWRDDLAPEHVDTIVEAHGPMMRRFGYLPSVCGLEATFDFA